jgi:hypothetical protein
LPDEADAPYLSDSAPESFGGNRLFFRKTAIVPVNRIFVSIRASTIEEILSAPSPVARLILWQRNRPRAKTFGSLIEQPELQLAVNGARTRARRNHSDYVAGRHPVNFVAGAYREGVRDLLRHCDLIF